jgi:hypothetical protein
MYNRPVEHLCSNSILVDEQFWFRKYLTTKKATYDLINGILCTLNEKLIAGGIFSALAKDFNCSRHDVLLLTLNCYTTDDKANEWIKTIIHFPSWGVKKHGVPQRSMCATFVC